jgi:hypothetical protein
MTKGKQSGPTVELVEPAKQPGNVSQACKMMGHSPS